MDWDLFPAEHQETMDWSLLASEPDEFDWYVTPQKTNKDEEFDWRPYTEQSPIRTKEPDDGFTLDWRPFTEQIGSPIDS